MTDANLLGQYCDQLAVAIQKVENIEREERWKIERSWGGFATACCHDLGRPGVMYGKPHAFERSNQRNACSYGPENQYQNRSDLGPVSWKEERNKEIRFGDHFIEWGKPCSAVGLKRGTTTQCELKRWRRQTCCTTN